MSKNIVLCGVGGQGTILASKLISAAAMAQGLPVKSAETIGMAQRGGSVFSHIRIGEDAVCPMIAKGTAVMPVTAALAGSNYNGEEMVTYLRSVVDRLMVVDTDKACRELGSAKIVNLLLLGAAAASGELGLSVEDIRQAVIDRVPPKFHQLNFSALDYAANLK